MARSTVSELIDRVELELTSSIRHETNWLGTNILSTDETITLEDDLVPAIRRGSILSVGTELMRVRSTDANAKEVTVRRGWRNTTAAAHTADDEVLINPRFTRNALYEAMIDEILSWGHQLFHVVSYQLSIDSETQTFELPASYADAIGLAELRIHETGRDVAAWPELNYRVMRGDVGVWDGATTSGRYVRIIPPITGGLNAGTLHALIAVPFDVATIPPTESDDLVANYDLEPSMIEVVELGMKLRVMGDAEHGRSSRDAQDEPRRAEEVPPGAALTVAQTLRQNYDRRFGDEVRRLQRKYQVRAW